jgi:hypothetical protein
MKTLLRAVLVVDALLLLGFGVLFLLTPWTSLYNALQLVPTDPSMVGQAFGVVLLGMAWLALRASVHGAMTTPVARTVGHVNWVVGVLMLVWLLALHKPALTGFGQLVSVLAGAVLLIVGFGGVRLAGAVRRRERALAAEALVAERNAKAEVKADRRAARDVAAADAANARSAAPLTAAGYVPVEPVMSSPRSSVPPNVAQNVPPNVPTTPPMRTAPVMPGVPLTPEEEAAREAARREARDAVANPRPPFHG